VTASLDVQVQAWQARVLSLLSNCRYPGWTAGERRRSTEDRRSYTLQLTERGVRDLCRRIAEEQGLTRIPYLHHRIMLFLIAASALFLFSARSRLPQGSR